MGTCPQSPQLKIIYQGKARKGTKQEAQLPQRNSAPAVHVYLGWLTDRAMHRTPQNRGGCTISDIQISNALIQEALARKRILS